MRYKNNIDDSGVVASQGLNVTDPDWHQLAITYDAYAGRMIGYVDGTSVGEIAVNGPTKLAEYWDPTVGSPWGDGFRGLVDNITFSDNVLSPSDIGDSYASFLQQVDAYVDPPPPTSPPGPPVLPVLFALDFENGEIADSSGNGITVSNGALADLTAGLNDTAYHLNGLHYSAGGNYLSIQGDDSLFSQDQIALSMAFCADVPGQGGDLFRIHTAMQIDVLDSGDVSFKLVANALGESGTIASLGVDVTDGAWHHIALSYDASGGRMAGYLDGNFVGEIAVSGPTKALEYWNPLIGNPWSGGFTGLIDAVNIFDSALGAADVAALHDAFLGGGQSSPPNASPIANDDVATTLEDTPLVLTPVELTGNDVDADGDLLTISDVSLVSGSGSVALLSSGLVVFTPTADDSGTALLEYEIQDGRGGQSTGQVTVTVTPINDAPMATAASFAILEDAQIGSLIGTIRAFDPEGQVLSYAITAGNDDNAFAVPPPRPARVWPTACGGSAPPGAWPAPRSTP